MSWKNIAYCLWKNPLSLGTKMMNDVIQPLSDPTLYQLDQEGPHLEQKSHWINIMPVEEKECRYIIHGLDIPCHLNKSGWIRQLERVRRRLYHKNVNKRSHID